MQKFTFRYVEGLHWVHFVDIVSHSWQLLSHFSHLFVFWLPNKLDGHIFMHLLLYKYVPSLHCVQLVDVYVHS